MSDYTVLDVETTGNDPWRHDLICVGIGRNVYEPSRGRQLSRMLMARAGTTLVAHTNYDLRWLMLDGATLAPDVHYHDTKVMAWLLDSTQELALDALAAKYLGYVPPKPIKIRQGRVMFESKTLGLVPIEDVPWDEMVAYNLSDIETEAEIYECLRSLLIERDLWTYFVEEKAPFSRLLVEMETTGLPFDRERGAALLQTKERQHAGLRSLLVEATGWDGFNPNSGDQVARYLYEDLWSAETRFDIPRLNGMTTERKLAAVQSIAPPGVRVERVGRDYAYGRLALEGRGLKPPKPKKRRDDEPEPKRPSVSAKKLNVMYGDDPWVSNFIEYQRAGKLSGYLRDWLEREHGGRLHGRFDQSGTSTGRLAGREPNLQQVSGEVRDLFRGDLVVGDYGGLEARLAAHFSRDPVMLDIFREGKDLYGVMAAHAWGGPEGKDNPGRGLMKLLWLSSQYGAQGETLAETLAVAGMRGYGPRKADALLRDLENTVPRMFEWRNEVIAEARALGYVTTISGRRRYLPDISSAVWKQMARAERQAVSTKVQGSAADVVEQAMLRCRELVAPEQARILLQVHDEILWERGPDWELPLLELLRDTCEQGHGFELDVPLVFEIGIAESWAEKGGSNTQAVAEAVAALA